VSNSDKTGIAVNPGDVKTITLGGTITVTHNGQAVPYVNVSATSGDWLGSADLEYPGANAPWSFSIRALDPPAEVRIHVIGYDANRNEIFRVHDAATVQSVSNSDKTGITINPGNVGGGGMPSLNIPPGLSRLRR
jgi:hypothetical protein